LVLVLVLVLQQSIENRSISVDQVIKTI